MSLLSDSLTGVKTSSFTQSSQPGESTALLKTIFKDPLNILYQLYVNTMNETITETQPTSNSETTPTTAPQRRLHPQAEDYRSSLLAGTASVVLKESNCIELVDLPVGVLLNIATYLDVKSLCHLQQTCNHMYSVTSDELLWRKKLREDSRHWEVVSHLSHPKVYQEVSSDLSSQEIYSSCYTNRATVPYQPFTQRIQSFMRRLQGHVPRLLMFGSGLETVPLVKRMILDTNSPYKPAGLFPGKDGAGSGMCIKHNNTSINLVTLYTATKAERTAASKGQGGRINKLISPSDDSVGGATPPTLAHAVQEQCQLADGFILAVDATNLDEEILESDMTTLRAMLVSCPSQRAPLLVLSCLYPSRNSEEEEEDVTVQALPSLDVADKLKLLDISNPWQVRSLNVKTFEGLPAGLDWLLTAAANK